MPKLIKDTNSFLDQGAIFLFSKRRNPTSALIQSHRSTPINPAMGEETCC
jgi:hypothetical protein